MAGSVSTPECQEADSNRQLRLIGNFKVCAPSRRRPGAWPSGRRSVGHRPDGTAEDQISVCSEISKASSTSMPR